MKKYFCFLYSLLLFVMGVVNNTYSNNNIESKTYFQATAIYPLSQSVTVGEAYTTLTLHNGPGFATFQWQQSTDNATWFDIAGATGTSYTPSGLSPGVMYYRLAMRPRLGGLNWFTNVATVHTNPLPIQVGNVTARYADAPLFLSCAGVSGGWGTYNFQWQSSTDNTNWSDMPGATALNAIAYPTGSTYYRLLVTSGNLSAYSNTFYWEVYPEVVPGIISPAQKTIHYNYSPGKLTSTPATAGNGTYIYNWESSADNNIFTEIPGATSLSYTPPALTATTYYRIRIPSAQGRWSLYTNTVTITVILPEFFAGTITPDRQVISSGTTPGELTANAATGGVCTNYSYQWQQCTDGINWNNINGANSQNYTPAALTNTTWFRRQVVCGIKTGYTNTSTITVGSIASCEMNYTRERIFTQPGILNKSSADAVTDVSAVKQSTRFFDGLGRLNQTVDKQGSSVLKDMVTPVVYDAFGREAIKYLPYVAEATDGNYRCNAVPEQKAFNNNLYSGERFYYGQIDFEASPLNRILRRHAPGDSWIGNSRSVTSQYFFNTTDDDVRIWTVTDVTDGFGMYSTPSGDAGRYPEGTLYKNVTVDEKGNQVIEFRDKQDRLILKKVQVGNISGSSGNVYDGWLCTYNIYDDWGNLRCVVQPRGVELLIQNSWDFAASNGDILKEQCFRYEYDGRSRMIRKKMPGAGDVFMVYDIRDRLVFTQEANMRANGQWLTTLYDKLSRPVITGITTWTGTIADLRDNAGSSTLDYSVDGMAVSNHPIPGGATFTTLSKTGYDDYSTIPAASGLAGTIDSRYTGSNFLNTSYGSFPYPEPVLQSLQTHGLPTWTQSKVLGTSNQYLYSVMIYDAKGRVVQKISKNITTGTDIITNQYTFSGQLLVNLRRQEKLGSANLQTHIIVTKNNYNELGQLKSIGKKVSSIINGVAVDKPELTILANDYDVLGQLARKNVGKKKDAGGNYTEETLQQLEHEYNIRGWLIGVNRNYLQAEGQTTDGTVFGFELGYDKTANKAGQAFRQGQFNGNINGILWKSDGDDIRRKYDFTYDDANRLLLADFEQQNADDHLWNKSKVDFTMRMGDGTLLSNGTPDPSKAYDANGNILQMQQWGLKISGTAPIDDMVYSYYNNSNKLRTVTEQGSAAAEHKLGDFTDLNTSGNDYGYDANGNVIIDRNKRFNETAQVQPDVEMNTGGAIAYNHLNLPVNIAVKDGNNNEKGTISYVYDASGNRLQKVVFEENVSVTHNSQSYISDITTTTTYLDGFVYESKSYENSALTSLAYTDKLLFMDHEEGRVRYIPAKDEKPAHYEYDYFIKDHLGNVRMVLTEENEEHLYIATMEHGENNKVRDYENQLFSNLDVSELSTPDYYPAGTSVNDPNLYVAKVNGNDQKKGPAIVLKVMAGDIVSLGVQSFYRSEASPTGTGNALNDILTSLAGGIVSASGVAKGTFSELSDPASSPLLGALNTFRGDKNQDIPDKPKAYLNWILLDEQFKYVTAYPQSNAVPVGDPDKVNSLASPEFTIAKNGYLYVYVSNETENWDVLFDDLSVNHRPGSLLEETHYYPFGLTMAGISSKAIGKPENRYKFNDGTELENKEFNDGSGLELYATDFRSYDPQIGRFHQQDPLAEFYDNYTPYAYANNNPVLINDPSGLAGDSVPLLPPVVVRPPKAVPSQPSMPGGIQPTRAGVAPLPLFPPTLKPVMPPGAPGKVIPLKPQPGPGPLMRIGSRALGTIGLLLITNPAGSGSYRWPWPSNQPFIPWGGHGNDENNTNPHIVYRFTFTPTDGFTPVIKYGISDAYRNDLDRPENQLPMYKAMFGSTVKYDIMARTINRKVALYLERYYVTKHVETWDEMPRKQIRPTPF